MKSPWQVLARRLQRVAGTLKVAEGAARHVRRMSAASKSAEEHGTRPLRNNHDTVLMRITGASTPHRFDFPASRGVNCLIER